MTTLADEFKRTNSKSIVYEGRTLIRSYELPVEVGDKVCLTFVRFAKSPVQGIRISMREKGCTLELAAAGAADFVVWTDTAPRQVEVTVRKAKGKCHLMLWNVWRDEKYGTTLYGLNNAAIHVVEESPTQAVLNISDGWLGPDFEDLVVRVARLERV